MNKAVTYLALPPDLSGPWAYGGKGRKMDWAKTDAQKSSLADKGDIILILSGENIRRYHLELPGLRGRELRSAIEFELEDRMGGAISSELICQSRKKPGSVAVVTADFQQALANVLEQYDLNPERIIVDYEAIGDGQNFNIGERYIKGGVEGYVVAEDWTELLPDAPDFTPITPDDLFSRFQENLSSEDNRPLDLREGLGFRAGHDFMWQRWAKIAALAAGFVILPFMLDRYAEARAWDQQAREDRVVTTELYQNVTGETPRDAALALSRQLKNGTTQIGFLDMSSVLFASLTDVEGAEIDTMRYDPRQGVLQLSIRYPSFEAGAALEQAALQRGGRLVVGGIRERGDTLVGEASFSLTSGGR